MSYPPPLILTDVELMHNQYSKQDNENRLHTRSGGICIGVASYEAPGTPTSTSNNLIFTARRNARIANAVLAMAFPSVCLRPSVTRRYCVKTTARSTVQFALLDSKRCLVLYEPKNITQGRPLPLKSWLQVTYPLLISASLDTFCLVAPQR